MIPVDNITKYDAQSSSFQTAYFQFFFICNQEKNQNTNLTKQWNIINYKFKVDHQHWLISEYIIILVYD